MMTQQPSQKLPLILIFSVMLMDIVGLLVIAPVAPFLVRRYSDQALMVTMMTVIYAAAQFFAAPFFGKLGDRYGRRPVLLVSVLGQAIGYLIFGVGGALWVLFLGRLIGGITGGNLSTATAYLADVSTPQERAKNFTLIGVAWGMGLIMGPAFGGMLSKISVDAPAYVAAGLSLLNVVLMWFFLPESLPTERRSTVPLILRDINPAIAIGDMARKPGLGWLLLANALFNFGFNGIGSINSLYVANKFQATPDQVGLLLAGGGITLAIVQFLLVQRVVPRFGEQRVAVTSLIGQLVGALGMIFTPVLGLLYFVYMFNSAVSGFTFPTLTTLNTNRVQHHEIGLLMGVTTAIASLMNIAGPLTVGLLYDRVGHTAPYWMGLVVFAIAAAMLARPQR
jgi:DHA1 family tetracycline resistance protein-like MFS transporter